MGSRFGDTTLARRTAWMVERYVNDDLTEADVREVYSDEMPVDDALRRFRVFRRPIDEVGDYRELSPTQSLVSVVCAGRSATVTVLLTDDAEGRIRMSALGLDPPPGVTVRDARPEDGPAIIELERRCPVVTDGVEVVYDRGEDYFAQHRLMGHHLQSVAEYEGRIVGTSADSLRRLRVGGVDHPSTYRFHLRVDPACRGMAIFPALNRHQSQRMWEAAPERRCVFYFQAMGNDTIAQTAGTDQQSLAWSLPMERLVIDCSAAGAGAAAADRSAGRPPTPADGARIAALLDASHGGEELAPLFDAAHVSTRLERSPGDYSWGDLLLGERAVVGVWDQRLGVTKRHPDGRVERSVRACTLDWGCEPGAEDELLALVRAQCTRLAETGTTHLSLFTSPPSPGRAALDELQPVAEPYRVIVQAPEPPGIDERGIYVDPIWF